MSGGRFKWNSGTRFLCDPDMPQFSTTLDCETLLLSQDECGKDAYATLDVWLYKKESFGKSDYLGRK